MARVIMTLAYYYLSPDTCPDDISILFIIHIQIPLWCVPNYAMTHVNNDSGLLILVASWRVSLRHCCATMCLYALTRVTRALVYYYLCPDTCHYTLAKILYMPLCRYLLSPKPAESEKPCLKCWLEQPCISLQWCLWFLHRACTTVR